MSAQTMPYAHPDARSSLPVSPLLAAPFLLPTLTPALAQGPLSLDLPDPPALPAPSAIDRYLFESPTLPIALLLLAAVVVLVVFHNRDQLKRGGLIAGICAALALIIFLTAHFVQTQREAMQEAARALVRAVSQGDTAAADQRLSPDAALYIFLAPTGMDRDRILDQLVNFRPGGAYAVSEVALLDIASAPDTENSGRVQLKVRVTSAANGVPNLSWWSLEMTRATADAPWQARGIAPLSITGVRNPRGQ